jgi:hypothetical protein
MTPAFTQAFWRALVTVMRPRVWLLALLPLLPLLLAVGLLGWALWEPALDAVAALVGRVEISETVFRWLHQAGFGQMRSLLAPMVVVLIALPLVLLLSLLAVALLAMPWLVRLIAERHHPALQAQQGCGLGRRLAWTAVTTAAALLALVLSVPLWLVPPLVLVLPPLIWGWLAARVLGYHALAHHASPEERRLLRRRRRLTLWAMGLATGYLATLPMALWALGSLAFVLAPFFMLAAAALFVAVFLFAAAWFTHLMLGDLARLREGAGAVTRAPAAPAAERIEPLPLENPAP